MIDAQIGVLEVHINVIIFCTNFEYEMDLSMMFRDDSS